MGRQQCLSCFIHQHSLHDKYHFINFIIMSIYLIISVLLTAVLGLQLRTHDYWFTKGNPSAVGNDKNWDYCDLKCLYLQHYYPDKDFVVLVLTARFKDTFAACYVKTPQGYTLWNKVVINPFYEDRCGSDTKDWANMGEFTISGVYGVGIGTQIAENATYT